MGICGGDGIAESGSVMCGFDNFEQYRAAVFQDSRAAGAQKLLFPVFVCINQHDVYQPVFLPFHEKFKA